MTLRTLLGPGTLAIALAIAPHPPALSAQLTHGDFEVRVHVMPQNAFATSVIVETASHFVVIDTGFRERDAEAVLDIVRRGGKPLAAVLLTHAHIDHYGGSALVAAGGIPLITGAGVARQLEAYGAVNRDRFGPSAPEAPTPTTLFGQGDSLVVDGVSFTLGELGPAESYSDVWWRISGRDRGAAVVGDVVMYGIPPLMQSGHSADWLRSLSALEQAIPDGWPIYIGHDSEALQVPNHAWDHSVIALQRASVLRFRELVHDITGAARLLTDAEAADVARRMREASPENPPAFDFIVTSSANIVAAELMSERAKADFERQIQALFRRSGG